MTLNIQTMYVNHFNVMVNGKEQFSDLLFVREYKNDGFGTPVLSFVLDWLIMSPPLEISQ